MLIKHAKKATVLIKFKKSNLALVTEINVSQCNINLHLLRQGGVHIVYLYDISEDKLWYIKATKFGSKKDDHLLVFDLNYIYSIMRQILSYGIFTHSASTSIYMNGSFYVFCKVEKSLCVISCFMGALWRSVLGLSIACGYGGNWVPYKRPGVAGYFLLLGINSLCAVLI